MAAAAAVTVAGSGVVCGSGIPRGTLSLRIDHAIAGIDVPPMNDAKLMETTRRHGEVLDGLHLRIRRSVPKTQNALSNTFFYQVPGRYIYIDKTKL